MYHLSANLASDRRTVSRLLSALAKPGFCAQSGCRECNSASPKEKVPRQPTTSYAIPISAHAIGALHAAALNSRSIFLTSDDQDRFLVSLHGGSSFPVRVGRLVL